jgi:hypothetical protein
MISLMSLESGAWAAARHPSPSAIRAYDQKEVTLSTEAAKELIHQAATLGETVVGGLGSLVAVGIVVAARLFPESTP